MRSFTLLAAAAALVGQSMAGYVLEDDYMTDFFGSFDFFDKADPTNGFVKYVDEATALSTNLIQTNATASGGVQWGVDFENKTPNGRPSVRIESKRKYDSGLVVLDVEHMPFGCGTWPAFWMVGPNWPMGGEIDILEGVNDQTRNGMTLHTGPGCKISPDTGAFAGKIETPNCDVKAPHQDKNVGCAIRHPSKASYGAGLNAGKGGVYATQWEESGISVFFFPRDSIPEDVLGDAPNPAGWGKPAAHFAKAGCDIKNMFKQQQIVFDTTFCGDWAGADWKKGSCASKASTCEAYVRDNPVAFKDAYWTINALKVYKSDGSSASTPGQLQPSGPAYPVPTSQPSQYPVPSPSMSTLAPTLSYSDGEYVSAPTSAPAIPSSSAAYAPVPEQPIPSAAPVPEKPNPSVPVSEPTAPEYPTEVPGTIPVSGILVPEQPVASPPVPEQPAPTPEQPDAPAPTGANGMPGFNWPTRNDGGSKPNNNGDSSSSSANNETKPKPTTSPEDDQEDSNKNNEDVDNALPTTEPVPVPSPGPMVPEPEVPQQYAPASEPASAPAPTQAPVEAPTVTRVAVPVKTITETVYVEARRAVETGVSAVVERGAVGDVRVRRGRWVM